MSEYLGIMRGSLHPSVYFTIFLCAAGVFGSIRFTWFAVAKAAVLTGLLYYSPCLFMLGVVLFSMWLYLDYQNRYNESRNRRRGAGVYFTHQFFGDNRFDGFTLREGASYSPIDPNSKVVPGSLVAAANRAVNVNPVLSNGDVILETRVDMVKGEPVITDSIVTAEQIERFYNSGAWDDPQPYTAPVSQVNVITGDLDWAVDDQGRVNLPAPTGLAAEFMSQFNGPKTQKRIRKS